MWCYPTPPWPFFVNVLCGGQDDEENNMQATRRLTAIIWREGDGYVALCPDVDVASQGTTVEEARANLAEALELFFEAADPSEVAERLHGDIFVTNLEISAG
jgi:predicted RNase H-like HicB family nuclease